MLFAFITLQNLANLLASRLSGKLDRNLEAISLGRMELDSLIELANSARQLADSPTEERERFSYVDCFFVISTYEDGEPPENARWFIKSVSDAASDFRVPKNLLNAIRFSIFGLGSSVYGDHLFNRVSDSKYIV